MMRIPSAPTPRAFTLIELLLAIAIGSLIILVAFAAVRSTERAYRKAVAAREANTLIVAGYRAAMAECDHWHAFDDPADPAAQPLRSDRRAFVMVDLPDAAWRWAPHDPRLWDRSGMRAANHRFRNGWSAWDHWPDHSQLAGVGHGHADGRFLHEIQRQLWADGGMPLLAAALPDHVPLGAIDNHSGWYDSGYGRGNFSAPRSWAGDGLHRALLWPGRNGDWSRGDHAAMFQSARYGKLDHGKRWYLAPRPGWSALNVVDNLAADLVRDSFQRPAGAMLELPGLGSEHDALLFAAGHPAFRGGEDGRFAHRFTVSRSTARHGSVLQVAIDLVDSESGERLSVTFTPQSTTLRGARIARRLDR